MKAWFLKVHRWLALVFALPFIVVIGTGLILSFEPWLVTGAIESGSLTPQKLQAILSQHDPKGQSSGIVHRPYDHTLTIGAGRGRGLVVDTVTGQVQPGPSTLANVLGTVRGLHERLLIDAGWVVVTSTSVMLAIMLLGIVMGWPRFGLTLAGSHKAIAWGLLPLILLSPVTGLLMASGITFATLPPAPAAKAPEMTLQEAVQIVGRDHDLSSLLFIRPQRGRLLARLAEDGEYKVYAVTPDGTVPVQRNWPRLWHEGNFAGAWSAAMNVIISLAMSALLVTGLWMWSRRQIRRRARRASDLSLATAGSTTGR
jgi:uncharacterized iron-regulated membrane protein